MHILYLVHRWPYPPDKGCRIRNYNVLKCLSSHAQVHLASLIDEPITTELRQPLESLCSKTAAVPQGRMRWLSAFGSIFCGRSISEGAFYSRSLSKIIQQWTDNTTFDAVVVSASSLAPYLKIPSLTGIPAIVDLVDVDSEKWLAYAKTGWGWRKWIYRLEGNRLRRLEQGLPGEVHTVMLVSEPEAELYRGFSLPGRVLSATNGVDFEYFEPQQKPENDNRCVFVGTLDYMPNVLGVTWFCRQVWPLIRQRNQNATVSLVGRNPTPAVNDLARIPGVKVVGSVPDVRPHLGQAAVNIAPLTIARGVQNKVLEALAMSKATVASREALMGLSLTPNVHAYQPDTIQEWVDRITCLMQQRALRQSLGEAGREYALQHHHWSVCLQPFLTTLEKIQRNNLRSTSANGGNAEESAITQHVSELGS